MADRHEPGTLRHGAYNLLEQWQAGQSAAWQRGDYQEAEVLLRALMDLSQMLSRHPDPDPALGWQDISTAPKDAELLWLFSADDDVQIGFWETTEGEPHWVCVETQGLTGGRMRPTHWQPFVSPSAPLPSPPPAGQEPT